jgi:hypothetical protein
MPSGWWHEVLSLGDGADGDGADGANSVTDAATDGVRGGTRGGLCVSVGLNWPTIGDAIANFGRYRESVRSYSILTKGQVLAMYYGEEKARSVPGFDEPVFA